MSFHWLPRATPTREQLCSTKPGNEESCLLSLTLFGSKRWTTLTFASCSFLRGYFARHVMENALSLGGAG